MFTANANGKFRLLFFLSNTPNRKIHEYLLLTINADIFTLLKGRRQSWIHAIGRWHTRGGLLTSTPSSSCEMIILRSDSHGGITKVCMGIFTTALRNEKILQILNWNTSPYSHRKAFFYVGRKPRNGKLAKMGSFHQNKRSDSKWYAVEVRCFFYPLERS